MSTHVPMLYCVEKLFFLLEFAIYVGDIVQNQSPISEVN